MSPGQDPLPLLWQNARCNVRPAARAYSHLPWGGILDDKWALALLQQRMRCETLASHCLVGRGEVEEWAMRKLLGGQGEKAWVLKDAGSNGVGGVWVFSADTWRQVCATQLHGSHRYVIQAYAPAPLLWHGRKCHVRAYIAISSSGSAWLHRTVLAPALSPVH